MSDQELIPLSALQHFIYCPRQCALIHVEQLWAESQRTAEGRLMHERVDQPKLDRRRGVRTVTAMPLMEPSLGITGIADVVEFHQQDGHELPYPVEYKRGKPKAHRADEVQLCAQALCLEHMLGCNIPEGALYYGDTRRRTVVSLDSDLRSLTTQVIEDTRQMIVQGKTPSANYSSSLCDRCSMLDLCQPKATGRQRSVREWIQTQLKD